MQDSRAHPDLMGQNNEGAYHGNEGTVNSGEDVIVMAAERLFRGKIVHNC